MSQAGLVATRYTPFFVGPKGDLIRTLAGITTLAILSGNCDILRDRMARGLRFVEKGYQQSQGHEAMTPVGDIR